MSKILIIARDFNAAKHWTNEKKLSTGRWVYISSYHNVWGNAGCNYIKISGCELRPDMDILNDALKKNNCVEIKNI